MIPLYIVIPLIVVALVVGYVFGKCVQSDITDDWRKDAERLEILADKATQNVSDLRRDNEQLKARLRRVAYALHGEDTE